MYDAIVVGTDGSETSSAAAEHAIELARLSGATVHAVYAIETRTAYDTAIVDPEQVEEALTEEGTAAVEEVRSLGSDEDDVEVITAVERGPPHEIIVAYADRIGADLIVIGERGRSAFKEQLLGSTADRVIRTATPPVLIVDE